MLYKRLIIKGEEYLLAVNQTGQGAPSENTVGEPGVLYMDTDTEKFHKCTAVINGRYIWKKFEEGSGNGNDRAAGAIICNVTGETLTMHDASDKYLAGLNLYGKTTQNGTPTPENPVELESVGDDGSVAVTVCGKNLLDVSKFTNQYYTADGNVADRGDFKLFEDFIPVKAGDVLNLSAKYLGSGEEYLRWALFGTDKAFLSRENGSMKSETAVINISQDGYIRVFIPYVIYDADTLQLERNPTATAYEPYKGQTLTAQTPNGLPGIPVSSGGNYTDENGQQWICDEIDFARGKYVQRVVKIGVDFFKNVVPSIDSNWYNEESSCSYELKAPQKPLLNNAFTSLCNVLPSYKFAYFYNQGIVEGVMNEQSYLVVNLDKSRGIDTVDKFKAWCNEAGFEVIKFLATPIETDLTAEEIAQYSALHTNYPNTTVYNDEGAYMSVRYVADTKLYIDNKFAELASAIMNNV